VSGSRRTERAAFDRKQRLLAVRNRSPGTCPQCFA